MFSNVRFIQASKDLTASQRNLKQLLILLCRVLFIIFLVLAFAQPFLPAAESTAPVDASNVAIAVDNSFSMQNVHEGQDIPLVSAASDRAKGVVELFPASTSYTLFTDGTAKGAAQATEAKAYLDEYAFSSRSDVLPSGSRDKASHLFLLSDFQKSTFKPSKLKQYDSSTQIHLLPLAAAGTANIAVDSVYLEDEFIRPSGDNILHVRVTNTGTTAVDNVPVKLFIEDQQVAVLSLDLPPQQQTEAVLNFKFNGTETKRAYVSVEDYPVEFDNTYFFVLSPSAPISITEITDAVHASPLQRLYQNEPLFYYTAYSTDNINFAEAAASDILILNGVTDFNAALATTVSNFVQDGGTVALIPPGTGDKGGYATLFQNLSISGRFTGGGSKTNISAPDPNSPFFRTIFSDYDPQMRMPEASRALAWSRASEDILEFRGGAPFLSRFDRGRGSIYVLASPLEEEYSSLANHALFVPIMYKMAISSYKQEQALAYSIADNTIQVPALGNKRKEGVYKLQKDSLALIPEQQVRGGKLYFSPPASMQEAGFYTLQLRDSALTTLAFNYGKEESYLEQFSPDELRELIGEGHSNVHVYDYGDSFSVKGEFEKRYFGVKLWKYCLILCLFFLMAEIALIRFL